MSENTVDISLILQFGLKCLGVFALIFLAAVFTPRMAEYIDKWKASHQKQNTGKLSRKGKEYTVRSVYELPPEEEQPKKKAVVRKKKEKR